MTIFQHRHFGGLLAALLGLFLLATSGEVLAQGIDYVVVVLPRTQGDTLKCATNPDTLHIRKREVKGNPIVAFLASSTKVTVSELNSRPAKKDQQGRDVFNRQTKMIDRNPNGPQLSDSTSIDLPVGGLERVVLNPRALGTYQYKVDCEGVPDAPPAIIVDP